MKKVLFIDRDGTLIAEPADEQIDSFAKLKFLPEVITNLSKLAKYSDFVNVMVTNQDGLGTPAFPENTFFPVQNFIVETLALEGIHFEDIHVDRSYPHENLPTRKPGIGMLTKYFSQEYDLKNSYVIGDRWTDVELAKNMGCKAIFIAGFNTEEELVKRNLLEYCALSAQNWTEIYDFLINSQRTAEIFRKTNETEIAVALNLNKCTNSVIKTGLKFFDHMLEQISKHAEISLNIRAIGDLEVDEHHLIEDLGISLGLAFRKALGNKKGMERYGFSILPMDECLAQVALDFSGRSYLVWDAKFKREHVGDFPCEMFEHFFKSFSENAGCNLNIRAKGKNEHHKIEAIFKAFAKSIKQAICITGTEIPSTKGVV